MESNEPPVTWPFPINVTAFADFTKYIYALFTMFNYDVSLDDFLPGIHLLPCDNLFPEAFSVIRGILN